MTPEQETLVTDGIPLVRTVAGRMKCWMPKRIDMEELIGAGSIGLVKAALKFDPTKGVPFAIYARLRIRGEILDDLRRRSPIKRKARARGVAEPHIVSIEEPISGGREQIKDTLSETCPGPAQLAESNDHRDHIVSLFKGRDRRIFELLYVNGFTQKTVGEILGVSESRICQINAQMRAMVRQHAPDGTLEAAS